MICCENGINVALLWKQKRLGDEVTVSHWSLRDYLKSNQVESDFIKIKRGGFGLGVLKTDGAGCVHESIWVLRDFSLFVFSVRKKLT